MKKIWQAVAIGALALVGSAANATWIDGDTVEYQYLFPNLGSNYPNASNGNHVVGGGVEVANLVDGVGTLNFSADSLLVDFTTTSAFNTGAFNGFRIMDVLGTLDAFLSVTIDPLTNLVGLDASRITFDANNIWVNWQGLSFNSNTFVSLSIGGRDVDVPEPSMLGLLALGLFGLAFGARRRRSGAAI